MPEKMKMREDPAEGEARPLTAAGKCPKRPGERVKKRCPL